MPYSSNSELPKPVKQTVPKELHTKFRRVFNEVYEDTESDQKSFKAAWSAVAESAENIGKSYEGLKEKAKEHNEKHGDKGRVTTATLKEVYDRGIGAYKNNPSSVRSNVSSKEQWAMARVNNFLRTIRTGEFKSGKHDTDLLPEDHKLSTKKASPSASSVHVPSTEWKVKKDEKTYKAPKAARENAKQVLEWKEKYGDEVKGMTQVGWERANQLANNENLSLDTVQRMAAFARHKKNSKVDPEHEGEPWKDAGRVAWLGWGGDAGINWAKKISSEVEKRQVGDYSFTTLEEAVVCSMDMGLYGEVHVHQNANGEGVYMPGASHEEYLDHMRTINPFNYTDDYEEDEEGYEAEKGLLCALREMKEILLGKSFDEDIEPEEGTIFKVDNEQRIAYGWASVWSNDGKVVFDSQGDSINKEGFVKSINDFMKDARTSKTMHKGPKTGEVIHSFPLTDEISKALGISTPYEGWIVGVHITDDGVWDKVKKGELTAFSIGGKGKRKSV